MAISAGGTDGCLLPKSTRTRTHSCGAFAGRLAALSRFLYVPDHPALKANAMRQTEKVRTVVAKNEARRTQSVERLARTAAAASWNVHRVHDAEDAATAIVGIAQRAGAKSVIRSAEDIFRRVNIDNAAPLLGGFHDYACIRTHPTARPAERDSVPLRHGGYGRVLRHRGDGQLRRDASQRGRAAGVTRARPYSC